MHAVLSAADALDLPLVALLGSTEYYRRFGFVAATTLGIEPQDPDWGDHFQVRTLTAYDSSITGPFRYAPAFDSL
jgi:putative acetyltransferase